MSQVDRPGPIHLGDQPATHAARRRSGERLVAGADVRVARQGDLVDGGEEASETHLPTIYEGWIAIVHGRKGIAREREDLARNREENSARPRIRGWCETRDARSARARAPSSAARPLAWPGRLAPPAPVTPPAVVAPPVPGELLLLPQPPNTAVTTVTAPIIKVTLNVLSSLFVISSPSVFMDSGSTRTCTAPCCADFRKGSDSAACSPPRSGCR